MSEFKDKAVLVTGATTGIGYATANRFAEAGARVLFTGSAAAGVEKARSGLGDRCIGLVADNTDPEAPRIIADACGRHLGHLDVMVLNAGVCLSDSAESLTRETYDRQVAINLTAPLFTVHACLPMMRRNSAILFTSSVNDSIGVAGQLSYSATKAAIRSVVRTLAVELAPRGIRVNSVAPGPIDTPIFEKALGDPAAVQKAKAYEAGLTAMKRMGQAGEVADAFYYLASSHASYITAADLRVDGGWGDV
jgi:NAD(P)-dependent dehydrogenase (short-subunit alcohol dehydrogenase family)